MRSAKPTKQTKSEAHSKRPRWVAVINAPWLWIAVACVPAVAVFCNRVLIPDTSTDVLTYHLFNGLRGASHPFVSFLPSEFYPVGLANFAPGYDILTYVARAMVGYRLGTGVSLLGMAAVIILLYKILKLLLRESHREFNAWWGLLLVNASIVLELYFQLATYFIDIINAAAVLGLVYFILKLLLPTKNSKTSMRRFVVAWLLLGVLLALKLTNIIFVVPLGALLAWYLWEQRGGLVWRKTLAYAVLAGTVFIVPLLPGCVQNYRLTHNPFFPFYNHVFASPYYPRVNFKDTNFGGKDTLSDLTWPVASVRHQIQLGEPHHIYNDYKLPVYWLGALLLFVLAASRRIRLGRAQKIVLCYFLASIAMWGLFFGIARYEVSTIAIGGLLFAVVCGAVTTVRPIWLNRVLLLLCALAVGLMGIEDWRILRFNMQYDMSWRPPLYQHQNHALHRDQLHSLFANQLALNAPEQQTVAGADVFINCDANVAGILALLPGANSKPMLNDIADGLPHYAVMTRNNSYRQQVLKHLQTAYPGKRTFTWVSIISYKDIGPTAQVCYNDILQGGGTITAYQQIGSFLGDSNFKLTMVSGLITP
jgi:hypothetical protein